MKFLIVEALLSKLKKAWTTDVQVAWMTNEDSRAGKVHTEATLAQVALERLADVLRLRDEGGNCDELAEAVDAYEKADDGELSIPFKLLVHERFVTGLSQAANFDGVMMALGDSTQNDDNPWYMSLAFLAEARRGKVRTHLYQLLMGTFLKVEGEFEEIEALENAGRLQTSFRSIKFEGAIQQDEREKLETLLHLHLSTTLSDSQAGADTTALHAFSSSKSSPMFFNMMKTGAGARLKQSCTTALTEWQADRGYSIDLEDAKRHYLSQRKSQEKNSHTSRPRVTTSKLLQCQPPLPSICCW